MAISPLVAALLAAALPARAAAPAAAKPASVVLIVADGLRADRLGVYGYVKPTSRKLDARAKEAVVFDRAYAAASWTFPSMTSLFTGLPPDEGPQGALSSVARLPEGTPLLPEAMKKAGLRTAGFVGGPFLNPVRGFDRGFDLYRAGGISQWQFLTTTSRQAERWIAAQDGKPFFVLVHGNDMHPPFGLPEADEKVSLRIDAGARDGLVDSSLIDYSFVAAYNAGKNAGRFVALPIPDGLVSLAERVRASPAELERIGAHYDSRVERVEEAVERVFAALDASGRRQDTIVVLLADHGLELGEHGYLAAGFHVSVREPLLRVPLIVWGPGVKPGRVSALVSLQDLGATMLELGGMPAGMPGRSFAALARGESDPHGPRDVRAASSLVQDSGKRLCTALWRGDWKLVRDDVRGGMRLYDLAKDPGQLKDLWGVEKKMGAELLSRLSAGDAPR